MRDRHVVWLGLALLLATTLACNAFAGQGGSSLPPPPSLASPAAPGTTPLPGTAPAGLAPTATLPGQTAPPGETTPAAAGGTLRMLSDLNVRAGPGVGYERVGFLLRDETAVIMGRDPASGWGKIECPPRADGNECWVSGSERFTQVQSTGAAP